MAASINSFADLVYGVAEAAGKGEAARAFELATAGIRGGMRHPAFHNARAIWFEQQGRFPDALREYQQALTMTPRDATLLNAIGLCYVRCNRSEEGIAALDAAIALDSTSAVTWCRKAWAHDSARQPQEAQKAYVRAIELMPDLAEAMAGVASIAAREGERDVARDYAERCLAIDPDQLTAIIALAMVENEEGNFAKAETMLRKALDTPHALERTKAILQGILGDSLNGQNRTAEAFSAYAARSAELRKLYAPQMTAIAPLTKMMASLAAYLETTSAEQWKHRERPAPVEGSPRGHVFLLGFIRSGTTLLERALDVHPDIVSLEERDSLQGLTDQFMHVPLGLDRLAKLKGPALDTARATYWRNIRKFGIAPENKIFIDKQPLNTFNLPLISKLFPEAKVLFALRDPRDVVFSCFRRHFEIDVTSFEFLDLADGARFYAAVMNVAELCRAKLPLTLLEHRYEDMVMDFEGRMRAVCDFIGIEWTGAMRDFSRKAREDTIRSPSAAQVRRPLYDQSIGQWRRYAKELAPALPILAPWVKRFGYGLD